MKNKLEKNYFTWNRKDKFLGYHNPETHWNGYAIPFFEKKVLKQIAKKAKDINFKFKRDGTVLYKYEDEWKILKPNKKCLYDLGGLAWEVFE
jgi:hypothetical protein